MRGASDQECLDLPYSLQGIFPVEQADYVACSDHDC